MKKYLDRWALKRVMANHPDLVQDVKAELKRTAAWEPHIKDLLIRVLKAIDPKPPSTR